MSQRLINRSPDLKKLQDDGYELEIISNHLVVPNVPYVDANRKIRRGTLVSVLDLAGDVTTKPRKHVVMFVGAYPCDRNGKEIESFRNGSDRKMVGDRLVIDHTFSCKPTGGYADYHEKMTTYINMISGQAQALDPSVTARTRRVIATEDPETVFNYLDTASSRAGIMQLSDKLALDKVAIVGLGGTGAYVLDLIAKTPVWEIHLFDGDDFLQHNAFRTPGAASLDELKAIPKKVDYLATLYAPMRKNIIPHSVYIDEKTFGELDDMAFVFLCIDRGDVKKIIVERLEAKGIPFIDVGMGVELVDNQLHAVVRVTTSTPEKRDHVRDKGRIGFTGGDADDLYRNNIQIADLNMLNAALAVGKWKRLYGFYRDFEQEHFSAYTIDGNHMINEDQKV
jgi:hypothetical protein